MALHLRPVYMEVGEPQIGEVTCGGSPHPLFKRNQIKMRHYMNRRVTPRTQVTTPNWGPPSPCIQALRLISKQRLWVTRKWLIPGKPQTSICNTRPTFPFLYLLLFITPTSTFKPVSSIRNILDSFCHFLILDIVNLSLT